MGETVEATVEDFERELAHVQGNFPEDTKRIADVKAAIAKAKKAKGEPAGLEAGEQHPDGWTQDGRRETPVNPQAEGNPSAVDPEPVQAVGNPKRKATARRRRKATAKKVTKPSPFDKEKAVQGRSGVETRG